MFIEPYQLLFHHSLLIAFFGALIGIIFGSFCNVLIYRLPLMINGIRPVNTSTFNLAFPRSFCPSCKNQIRWYDNIPVLSWFLLKGKCRICQSHIPFQYVFLEILFGILAFIFIYFLGITISTICYLFFLYFLVTLAWIDAKSNYLPDILLLCLFFTGCLFNIHGGFASIIDSLIGAITGFALLYSLAFIFSLNKDTPAMYPGDFKYAAVLGWWFGFGIFFIFAVASNLACLYFLFFKKKSKSYIAFGPWLSIAAGILFFFHFLRLEVSQLYLLLPSVVKNATFVSIFN